MLILTRKKDESIFVGDDVEIMIVEIRGDKVRLGIQAPKDVPVHRSEIKAAIDAAKRAAKPKDDEAEETT